MSNWNNSEHSPFTFWNEEKKRNNFDWVPFFCLTMICIWNYSLDVDDEPATRLIATSSISQCVAIDWFFASPRQFIKTVFCSPAFYWFNSLNGQFDLLCYEWIMFKHIFFYQLLMNGFFFLILWRSSIMKYYNLAA